MRALAAFLFVWLAFSPLAGAQNKKYLEVESTLSAPSTAGEPIRVKVTATSNYSDFYKKPKVPLLADWHLIGIHTSVRNYGTFNFNGRIDTKNQQTWEVILQPKRKGKLKVPKIIVSVGGVQKATRAREVLVTGVTKKQPNVAGGNIPSTVPRIPSRPNPFMPRGRRNAPGTAQGKNFKFEDITGFENFFVRGHPSKQQAYVGELIVVDFYLYTQVHLSNLEGGKYPQSNDFLKEELYTANNLVLETVMVNSQPFRRTRMISYALFPLKEGNLSFDTLTYRATINGRTRSTATSTPIDFKILPLPEYTGTGQFNGSVGDYEMEIMPLEGSIVQNQPFSLKLNIRGKGNVKSINQPDLKLPAGLELQRVKPLAEIGKDATGYKSFEYLILPKEAGELMIPQLEWVYFNPNKEDFETLQTPELKINVLPSSGNNLFAESTDGEKKASQSWEPIYHSPQKWTQLGSYMSLANPKSWISLAAAYLLLAFGFLRRKQKTAQQEKNQNEPWHRTRDRILEKSRSAPQTAGLVDRYLKQKLVGSLSRFDLHEEDPRERFTEALEASINAGNEAAIANLEEFWAEIDRLRFAGKNSKSKHSPKILLSKADNLLDLIESSKRNTDS